jgi:O-antigen/teichoic acid export membrane protein
MTTMEAAPGAGGRGRRASLGALALTGASVLRLSLQFAMLPILARLIGPAEYGLVALAMPFILLANVLADGGMGYALGRRQEVSRDEETTVFWLSGAIGLALSLACCLAAWPMGALMDQPRLPLLIAALSPILFLNSLTTVANGRIIREGRFAIFAGGDLISTVASAGTALAAALAGWGAWALVAQQLVLWTCKLAWVASRAGTPIRWHYRFEEAKRLLTFGVHTIGAILADFAARNLDSLIVGGVLGATTLGYYAMAYQLVRAPDMLISGPLYLYIFTAVARTAQGSPAAMQDLAAAGLRLGVAALAPVFCGLALTADLAVPLVLGDKWVAAIVPLRLLCAAGFFFCLCSIMATTLMGLGKSALRLKLSLALGVATVGAVALCAPFGLQAVSAGAAAAMGAVCGLYLCVLARELGAAATRLAAGLGPAAIGCAAMAAAVAGVRSLALPPVGEFAVAVLVGASVYLGVLSLFRRRLIADARAFGRAQSDDQAVAAA